MTYPVRATEIDKTGMPSRPNHASLNLPENYRMAHRWCARTCHHLLSGAECNELICTLKFEAYKYDLLQMWHWNCFLLIPWVIIWLFKLSFLAIDRVFLERDWSIERWDKSIWTWGEFVRNRLTSVIRHARENVICPKTEKNPYHTQCTLCVFVHLPPKNISVNDPFNQHIWYDRKI